MSRGVLGVSAVAVAIVLAVTGIGAGPGIGAAVGLETASLGLVLLVLALWRWPQVLAPAMVLLAVPWGFAMAEEPGGAEAIAVGAGLVLLGELGGWCQDRRTVVPEHPREVARRAARTLGLVGAGVAVSATLLATSALPAPGSLVRLLVGLGAALAVVALTTLRRWDSS
jgi:hypothetical protein